MVLCLLFEKLFSFLFADRGSWVPPNVSEKRNENMLIVFSIVLIVQRIYSQTTTESHHLCVRSTFKKLLAMVHP